MGEARSRTSGRHVFFALLLAATLLVCHGLFGASHLLAHEGGATRTVVPATGDHPHETKHPTAVGVLSGAHHATGHVAGTTEGPPMVTAEYFAVLLVLAGVALLAALPGRAMLLIPRWRTLHAGRTLLHRPPPKGPSPPLLQVFRL